MTSGDVIWVIVAMRDYHDASRRRLSRITGVEIVAVVVS